MFGNLNSKLERAITSLPLLTVVTFVYGYIGFRTFTTVYSLPVISTEISTVAGIGLFNLTYLGLLYITATRKRKPRVYEALAIYLLFSFLLTNPILIAGILVLQLVSIAFTLEKAPKRFKFSQAKERIRKYRRTEPIVEIVITVIGMIISFIIDIDSYTILIVIYVILLIFHRYKRYKVRPDLISCSVLILFPVITMYYFINSSKANILGLSKPDVQLIIGSDTVSSTVIYVDELNYYVHHDSLKRVEIVKKDAVTKIISKSQTKTTEGAILFFKRFYRHFFSDTAISITKNNATPTATIEKDGDSLTNDKVDTSSLEGKQKHLLNTLTSINPKRFPDYDTLLDLTFDGRNDYIIGYYGQPGTGLKISSSDFIQSATE